MNITIKERTQELDVQGNQYTASATAQIEGQEDMELYYHSYENNLESEDERFDDNYDEINDAFHAAPITETYLPEVHQYIDFATENMDCYTEHDIDGELTLDMLNECLKEAECKYVLTQEDLDNN